MRKEKELFYDIKGDISTLKPSGQEKMELWRSFIVDLANHNNKLIYINGDKNKKRVALTFDDGPDSKNTEAIIDILNEKKVKGNFFFQGSYIYKYSNVVEKAFKSGHLTLNHSENHLNLKGEDDNTVKKGILVVQKKLKDLICKEPNIIRLPYGSIDESQVELYKDLGLKIVFWSLDTLDWSTDDSEFIINNVKNNMRPGDIILMHSNIERESTVKALPEIIDYIKESGYEIVTLNKLLDIKAYKK